jgi:hypothetical protein
VYCNIVWECLHSPLSFSFSFPFVHLRTKNYVYEFNQICSKSNRQSSKTKRQTGVQEYLLKPTSWISIRIVVS